MYQDSSYLLLQVGTHADVGNVEFWDNVCDMECVGVFPCVRYNCSAQGY